MILVLTLLALFTTFGIAFPQNMVPGHATPKTSVDDQYPSPDLGLPFPPQDTVAIKWGNQTRPAAAWLPGSDDPAAPMRHSTCYGHHGIANVFFDKAVEKFCLAVKDTILDLDEQQNSPGGSPPDDCGETGAVYMHIGFGLGALKARYHLSEFACIRGLQRVYKGDCDSAHKDNKHGGQLDLGTFNPPPGQDADFNDHLFYLADPNPPLRGRNPHCSNRDNRFLPNLENTKVYAEFVDPCYEVHLGFGGDDQWDMAPDGWKDWDGTFRDSEQMTKHDMAKDACVLKGGVYDKHGGKADNIPM
ncbi:hypothetical protein B0A48_07262 [Cryoendolithus antarcticus]|uniref:Ecp2 effector protein domain-containing protein n=1 Tax=Cryoendolithus antarcticus TaxID=1507870 RepID=A0A1V8T837_9PEZI|nr:hypothetical protein B0A48_07262 [Cryoendolithus antarcticus]